MSVKRLVVFATLSGIFIGAGMAVFILSFINSAKLHPFVGVFWSLLGAYLFCVVWRVLRDIPKAKNEGRQGMDIKTIEQIIRNIPNPYPKDIFTPIDSATLKEIHKLLMREMNMPLDRLSGEIARRVIEAFREQVIREIKVYED